MHRALCPRLRVQGSVSETHSVQGSVSETHSVQGSVSETRSVKGSVSDSPDEVIVPDEHEVLEDGQEVTLCSSVLHHTHQHAEHVARIGERR